MKFLWMAALFVLAWYVIQHFNLQANSSLVGILGGLAGALFVASRQLKKANETRQPQFAARSKPVQVTTIKTSAAKPYLIRNPSLGLLNYLNEPGDALIATDLEKLGGLFPRNVHVTNQKIQKCNVLFIYCNLEPSGRIAGQQFSLRDVIRTAGAHVVVVASEQKTEVITGKEFNQFLSSKDDWPANIVFTLNRNGEVFGVFFQRLLAQMRAGVSMPLAWVKLAPQGPNQNHAEVPGTIVLLEAGHIALGTHAAIA